MISGTVSEVSRVYVDGREAGPGHLSATVQGLKHDVVVGIRDNQDGTYELSYTPPTAGAYVMIVKWNDNHVPGSPFKITVTSRADASSVGKFSYRGLQRILNNILITYPITPHEGAPFFTFSNRNIVYFAPN